MITTPPDFHTATIRIKSDDSSADPPNDFELESLMISLRLRFAEMKMHGTDPEILPPYLRAHLGKCILTSKSLGYRISCYPSITIFETGVLLLDIRVISPERKTDPKSFIEKFENMFMHEFDEVLLPPGLLAMCDSCFPFLIKDRWKLLERFRFLKMESEFKAQITSKTIRDSDEIFEFQLAPTTWEDIKTTTAFFHMVTNVVSHLLNKRDSYLASILFGPKEVVKLGGYWTSHPHVHLLRFSRQCGTSRQNEFTHKNMIGQMLARTYVKQTPPGLLK